MSHDRITSESDRNEFPEYMLGKNQEESPANFALFSAALNNNLPAVHEAVRDGGKVDFFNRKEDSKNALHVSAENGFTNVVDALLKCGAAVNAIAVSGHDNALTLCCHGGHLAVAKLLLDNGADINAANGYGNTALHEACHSGGNVDLVRLLITRGANCDAENHKGSTPLHFLCYGENSSTHTVAMAQELLKSGANVNHRDHRGMTAMLVCCSSGREDFIESLMSAGADPTMRDGEGRSAYDVARFYNQERIAKRFAEESPASRFDYKK